MLLLACTKPLPPAAPADREAPTAPTPSTAYRVGDFVVYAYTGSALAAPVEIREEIVEVSGIRLTILVEASRGDERRRWKQVVTDTPENRANDVVDELYELVGQEERALTNEGNADIYRLYEWIVPPLDGPPSDIVRSTPSLALPGRTVQATCSAGIGSMAGEPARVTFCDSEDFLWTKVSGEITSLTGAELLYGFEVRDTGWRQASTATPAAPDLDGARAEATAQGWRACEEDADCAVVRCSCSCSGCGGFSADDTVHHDHVQDWYTRAGCSEALVCPMVCCAPRTLVCQQGQCGAQLGQP